MNKLIKKLSWDEPREVQEEAIKLLKQEKDLSIFLQPIEKDAGKKVWDNCALILCSKTDKELIPYIEGLLNWLQDMNWPGAWEILGRLQKISKELIKKEYDKAVKRASRELKELNEKIYPNSWLGNLKMINTQLKKSDFFEQ